MKNLVRKLYDRLTRPIYERLSRDVVLHMQEIKRAQLEFQERFASRMADQLVSQTLMMTQKADSSPSRLDDYSDDLIIEIIDQITHSEDLVTIARDRKLPLIDVCEIYSRYGCCAAPGIRHLRKLEQQARQQIDCAVPNGTSVGKH